MKLTATTRLKTGGKIVQEGEVFEAKDAETAESLVSAGLAVKGAKEVPRVSTEVDAGPTEAPLRQTVPGPAGSASGDDEAAAADGVRSVPGPAARRTRT